jgi:hypothetical protein
MIRTYQRRWLGADVVAGVTIFAIMSGGIISIIVVIYLLVDRNVRKAFRTGS